MLKYVDTQITFSEVPDEVSLTINLSNCPIHCPSCHSQYLWEDIGTELTEETLKSLIEANTGITCVCFMGGDNDPEAVNKLSEYVHNNYELHTCWYSGYHAFPGFEIDFDYVKIGPYIEKFGGLDNPNTNQRFYIRGRIMNKMDANPHMWYNITDKFWKNEENSNN